MWWRFPKFGYRMKKKKKKNSGFVLHIAMVGKILLSTWGVDQGYGVRWLADVRRDD